MKKVKGKILSYLAAFAAAAVMITAFPAVTASAYEIPEWKETSLGVFTAKGVSYETAPQCDEAIIPTQLVIPTESLIPNKNSLSDIESLEIAITVNGTASGGLGYQGKKEWVSKTWENTETLVIDDAAEYDGIFFSVWWLDYDSELTVKFTVTCKDGSKTNHKSAVPKRDVWTEESPGIYTYTASKYKDSYGCGKKPADLYVPVMKLLPEGKTAKDIKSVKIEARSLNWKGVTGTAEYYSKDQYKSIEWGQDKTGTVKAPDDWNNFCIHTWWVEPEDTVSLRFTVTCKDGTTGPEAKTDDSALVLCEGKQKMNWDENVTISAKKFASVKSGDTIRVTYTENGDSALRIVDPSWKPFSGIKTDEWDNARKCFPPYSFKVTKKDANKLKMNGMLISGENLTVTKVELIGDQKAADSRIYCYDSDMKLVRTVKIKEGTSGKKTLGVNLGEKYAGKKVTLYKGKKSVDEELETAVLDENGKAAFKNTGEKSYTLVIED